MELRSAADGARRATAAQRLAAGKPLTGSSNRSRPQLLLLCTQTEGVAQSLSTKRLLAHGSDSVAKQRRAARAAHTSDGATVARAHVASLVRTWAQPRRAKPLTASGCRSLVPKAMAPHTKCIKKRGNQLKDKVVIKAGLAAIAKRAKQSAQAKIVHARSKPLNRRTERLAAAKPAGVVPGQRVSKGDAPSGTLPASARPRRVAAAVAVAAAAQQAAEDMDGSDVDGDKDGDEDGGMSGDDGDGESDIEGEMSVEEMEMEPEEADETESGGDGEDVGGEEVEGEAEERAALEARYTHLKRNIALWEKRFMAEHDGKKPRSADYPFHVTAEREEYFALKVRLGRA